MSKLPTPIKTDLFRFATVRTPQLINEEKKKYGYLKHPDPSRSEILSKDTGTTIVESRNMVQEAAERFKAAKTPDVIKRKNPGLYVFSQWLSRRQFDLVEAGVVAESLNVNGLDDKTRIWIWDNLIYEVLERQTPAVRQICIMMLTADYVLNIFKNEDYKTIARHLIKTPRRPHAPGEQEQIDLFLRRLAQTKIVLPKSVSKTRYLMTSESLKAGSIKRNDVFLKSSHRSVISKDKQKRYQSIGKEIRQLRTQYQKLGSVKVSDFLGDKTVLSHLAADSAGYLKQSQLQQLRLDLVERTLSRKGAPLVYPKKAKSAAKTTVPRMRYIATLETFEGQTEVYLTINTGSSGAFVNAVDGEIQMGTGRPIKITQVREAGYDGNGGLTLQLQTETPLNKGKERVFSVNASFELSDGSAFAINNKGSVDRGNMFGNGTLTPAPSKGGNGSGLPSPTPDTPSAEPILYGVTNLGVGVYRKVEQEVCCYVPGEVSHIENILAREYKERHTRSLISSESTEEESTETETEKQSDTSSTNRYELQTEIAKVLEEERSFGAGASLGVSAEYMGVSINANGNIDYATSDSSSLSDSQAATYAQEVTNKALDRILTKTSIKRTTKILQEYEENNRHGFDNREGTQHVTGVYRWIDIIYINRLVNYGKRLMVEFVVPEPARFYRMVLEKVAAASSGSATTSADSSDTSSDAPETLESKGIESYEDINEDNYSGLASYYGVTVEEPLPLTVPTLTKTFGPNDDPSSPSNPDAKELSYNFEFNFSEREDYSKYEVSAAETDYSFEYHLEGLEDGTYFKLIVGTQQIKYDKNNLDDSNDKIFKIERKTKTGSKTLTLEGTKNSVDISVNIKNVYDFAVTLKVDLQLSDEERENWQRSVYNALLDAYNDMQTTYETEVEAAAAEAEAAQAETEQASLSSDQCRQIEKRELKRLSIELLTKPFGNFEMGQGFYTTGSGSCEDESQKPEQINQTEDWLTYSSNVKFFEQAFDWELMSYVFYPYYWADKCKWAELCATTTGGDDTFLSFLQSGMARIVVPARKGFGRAITYYMETGDIWNGGGLVVDTDDDLYVSIEEEVMEIEGHVEKEWETRVPTTLTIVQGSSVYLEDEGLPCCEKVDDGVTDTLLRGSTTILGTSETTTTTA